MVPQLQEVGCRPNKKGVYDNPSHTPKRLALPTGSYPRMVPDRSTPTTPTKLGQKFRQTPTILHSVQGKQGAIPALVMLCYKNVITIK